MEQILTPENQPLVSVIMPAYNAERYIEEAVRSVMAQTVADWELLVIDDCSGDSTCSVVERLAREDGRITLLRNETNLGVAKTRNKGLDLCRGSYVALLDSDDVWHETKLERQLQLAEKTGADIVYCSYSIVNERREKICEDFFVPEETDFKSSLTQSVISCSTALLSRRIVDQYRFNTEYYHEDLALWLQILRDGHSARGVTEVLAEYRVMEGTRASNKLLSALRRFQVYRKLMGFSVMKSLCLLAKYTVLGLKKYKKAAGGPEE